MVAKAVGQRHQAFDPVQVRIGVERFDDDHDVDVGRENLRLRGPVGAVADQGAPAWKHDVQRDPIVGPGAHGHPVAHRRQSGAILRGIGEHRSPERGPHASDRRPVDDEHIRSPAVDPGDPTGTVGSAIRRERLRDPGGVAEVVSDGRVGGHTIDASPAVGRDSTDYRRSSDAFTA